MADVDNFYLVLPSDGCPTIHPDNVPHNFRITLDQGIALQGDGPWEVALSELSYVNAVQIFGNNEQVVIKDHKLGKYGFHADQKLNYVKKTTKVREKIPKNEFWWHPKDKNGEVPFTIDYDERADRFIMIVNITTYRTKIRFPHYYLVQLGFKDRRAKGMETKEELSLYEDVFDHATEDKLIITGDHRPAEWIVVWDDIPLSAVIGYMKEESVSFTVTPYQGTYVDMNAIISQMNDMIVKKSTQWPHVYNDIKQRQLFQFNKHTGRVHLFLPNYWSVEMKGGLHHILGFKDKRYFRDSIAEYAPSQRASVYSIYVYCNIVEVQRVGHDKVRLLRTIPLVVKQIGETVTARFEKLRYCPLNTNYIHMIEIALYNDSGNPIKFDEGKTLSILHFRRQHV